VTTFLNQAYINFFLLYFFEQMAFFLTDNLRSALITAKATVVIPVVELWMRKKGVRHCQLGLLRLASLFSKRKKKRGNCKAEAERVAQLVNRANSRYSIYPADCLARSLALQYLLACEGIESELLLGARTLGGQFEAHAWVEVGTTALLEEEYVREVYQPFEFLHGKQSGK